MFIDLTCTYIHIHMCFFYIEKHGKSIKIITGTQTECILKQIISVSASPDRKLHALEMRIPLGHYLEVSLFITSSHEQQKELKCNDPHSSLAFLPFELDD